MGLKNYITHVYGKAKLLFNKCKNIHFIQIQHDNKGIFQKKRLVVDFQKLNEVSFFIFIIDIWYADIKNTYGLISDSFVPKIHMNRLATV